MFFCKYFCLENPVQYHKLYRICYLYTCNYFTGMKNEWATVKDSKLYVGSHGKEHVTKNGTTVTGQSMMWVKTIDANGVVKHLDWAENFEKLRAAVGNNFPGYLTHESCEWSDVHGRWFFLPRKASAEPYNDLRDERSATNILLAASPDFENIKVCTLAFFLALT